MVTDVMEKLVSLCKRRGFIFPGSELYGGLNGTWDLGPLGVSLSNNIKKEWWREMVLKRDDVVGLDSSILHNSKVWEASGHVTSFTDPLIECKICHERFREDFSDKIREHEKLHDVPGWTDVKQFNLMFETHVGPIKNEAAKTFLRPETAQGIFINFENVVTSSRVKIPFGIAQIGKGFRNEITTGNFLFRVREFEMMELEFFVKPGTDEKWHEYWKEQRLNWYLSFGIRKEHIKLTDLSKKDIAHYSRGTSEIWYKWPFATTQGEPWGELEGIANRGDYDLKQHSKHSGKVLEYFDDAIKEKYTPYVIEPSVGVGRAMLAFLIDAYHEEEKRVILKLSPKLSPVSVAVFPLLANKDQLVNKAKEIYQKLKEDINGVVVFDDRGNIGKRYLSQDEIGTPFCVTVDFQTLEDSSVTVRDRDTTKQDRVSISKLHSYFFERFN